MEQIVEELKALRMEMEQMKKARADPQGPVPMDAEGNEEDSEPEDPSWGNILVPTSVEPSTPAAQFLCQVMSSPLHWIN